MRPIDPGLMRRLRPKIESDPIGHFGGEYGHVRWSRAVWTAVAECTRIQSCSFQEAEAIASPRGRVSITYSVTGSAVRRVFEQTAGRFFAAEEGRLKGRLSSPR